MKAQINIRSTLSNSTALQRGSAALAAVALLALIGALMIYVVRPSTQAIPPARINIPTQRVSPNALDFGTGSVYDGGHYVDWQPVKRVSPNALDFGTGSVYDGGHYGSTISTENATVKP
jgi:hypothetical protein